MNQKLKQWLKQIHPERVVVAAAAIAILTSSILYAASVATRSAGLRRAGLVAFLISLAIFFLPLTTLLVVLGIEKLRHK